jgi:uncharacterized protein YecT (DUF1311 family)
MSVRRKLPLTRSIRAGLVVVASLSMTSLALASCGSSTSRASAAALRQPVIVDGITPGPCRQTSQFEMDVCAGDQLLAADHLINVQMALLWAHTPSLAERRQLIKAQKAWLKWRTDNCALVSTDYRGGSIEPMEYAGCEATADAAYSRNLYSLFLFEWQGDAYQWPWPTAVRLAEHAAGVAACTRLYFLTDHSIKAEPSRKEVLAAAKFISKEISRSHDRELRDDLDSLHRAEGKSGTTGEWLAASFRTACTDLGVPYEDHS